MPVQSPKANLATSPSAEAVAMDALRYLVQRITADPRLAWLIGPGSETYERAMAALAMTFEDGGAELRRQVETNLKTTPWPRTRELERQGEGDEGDFDLGLDGRPNSGRA